MDIHSLARLVPARRIEMVQSVEAGLPVAAAARLFMVSRQTVYKWLRRWREGDRQLLDHSSRPNFSPRQLDPMLALLINLLRQGQLLVSAIATTLKLPRSTVGRYVTRAGLGRLSALIPRPQPVRYEMAEPGELVHMDIKPLRSFRHAGRLFIDEGGHRQRGRSDRQYLHVAIDSCTRYAVAAILPAENALSCIQFLTLALERFATAGIVVRRVLTDNGAGYRSLAFGAAMSQHRIRHSFTRVRRPQTNGKAERFIRSAMQEWGYLRYHNSNARNAALPGWLEYYNERRPHHALNHMTPCHRLNLSTTS